MANFKFVKSATALVLGASVLTSAVVVPGADASAKTTYKVTKSGTLVDAKTNKAVKGYKSYKGKLYKNGKILTGLYNNKYYYKNGVKATGTYAGAYYYKGSKKVTTGTYNNAYYYKGVKKVATGIYNNYFYLKGVKKVGTGVYNNYFYLKGVKKVGTGTYNGAFYLKGVKKVTTGTYAGAYYDKGVKKVATGTYNKAYYVDGKKVVATGLYESKFYKDGVLNVGLALYEEKLYNGVELNKGLNEFDGKYYYDATLADGIYADANGVKKLYKDGSVVDLAAKSASAINANQISVTFNNDETVTVDLTEALADGATKVSFEYNGQTFTDVALDAAYEAPDKEAPVLKVNGETTVNVENGAELKLPEVTATDNKDESVEVKSVITNAAGETVEAIDTKVAGTYTVTYSAEDAAKNAAENVVVTVVVAEAPDTEAPVLSYDGETTINVENGAGFEYPVVTATDNKDESVTVKRVITDESGKELESIDTKVAGTYTVTYTAEDAAKNAAKPVVVTVVVAEAQLQVVEVSAINAADLSSVSINDSFKYTFSKELDDATVNSTNFQLLKGSAVTPVKVTLGEDKKTVTVEPTSNLSINSDYKLVAKTAVKDVDGQALTTEYSKDLKTNNNAVATNLTLKTNAPANIDTDVTEKEVVTSTTINQLLVTYNGSLSFDAASKSNVELTDANGNVIAVDTVTAAAGILTIDLGDATKDLKNGTYTLKVKALSTADGRTVDAFTRTFSVNDANILVSGTTLADGSTTLVAANNVYGKTATKYDETGAVQDLGFKALVKFNTDADATTVNNNTIVLKKASNGEVVPATVTYNADAKTAAVVPASDLEDLTDYQLVVSAGGAITDKFGKKLNQQDPVTFKTADTTAPTVVSTTPANGASATELDGSYSFTFSEPVDTSSFALSTTTGNEATAGLDAAATAAKSVFLKNETTGDYLNVATTFDVEFSSDKKTVTFKPKTGVALTKTNSYSLILRGGKTAGIQYVTDATSGTDTAVKLAENYKLSFATGEGDTTGPAFVEAKQGSTVLANGAKSVDEAGTIEFYYNEALTLPTAAQTGDLYALKLADGTTKTIGSKVAATAVVTPTLADTASITVPDLNTDLNVGDVVKVTIGTNVYYRTVATAYTDGDTSLVLNAGLPEDTAALSTVEALPLQIVNDTTNKKYKVVADLNGTSNTVAANESYSLKLTDVFADATGNKAKEPTLTFTTGPAPALSVASAAASTPFKFDNGFAVDETAFIQFDDTDIDFTTVTNDTLYFENADGTKAPYEIVAKSATATGLGEATAVKGNVTSSDTIIIDDAGVTGGTNVTDVAAGDILHIATSDVFVKVVSVTQGSGETTIKVDRNVTVNDNEVVTRIPAVMLQPKSGEKLAAKTTYKLKATSGIQDKAGNPLKATEYAFTTAAVAPEKLALTATSITDGATNVKVNAPITLTFNEKVALGAGDALSDFITVEENGHDVTSKFDITYDKDNNKVVLVAPKGYLVDGAVYEVSVANTATSVDGDSNKELGGTGESISFQAETTASVKPKVVSAEYFDLGTSGLNAGDLLKLTFSAPLGGTTSNLDADDDFTLAGLGADTLGTLGAGDVILSSDKKSVTIKLQADTVFAAGVSTIAAKTSGGDYTWEDGLGNTFDDASVTIVKK